MSKPPKAIEFKASTLTAMTAILRETDPARLTENLQKLLGDSDDYFAGELAVLDFGQLTEMPEHIDWAGIAALLRRYGLQTIAVRAAPESMQDGIRTANFAVLPKLASRATAEIATPTAAAVAAPAPVAETTAPVPAPIAATPVAMPTKVIDRPVRSGQQIYARDGDLILLNGVSPGAEVIADGSIHCYGPLRGRAVAGAQGSTAARIFCSNFGPELISIAGVYRTFEGGIVKNLAGKPAQALLRTEGEKNVLNIEALQLD